MPRKQQQRDYDCIVVGAGVQGCFTAYQLAKNNQKTLLLEQFLLPHSRGSSHGQTRIIRKAYEQDFYAHMMEECYHLWAQLERETNMTLFRRTGLLVKGPRDVGDFRLFQDTLRRGCVPTETLTPDQFAKRLPNMVLMEGEGAVIDTTAGVLYADKALKAAQSAFQSLGGVIKDGEKVISIQPGSTVTVTTASGEYRAKSLIVTAGPWANILLAHTGLQLPLTVVKINVCYWREKVPGAYGADGAGWPCFLQTASEGADYHIYGLPSHEYPGLMKICYHMGSVTEPDQRDRQTDRSDIRILSRFVSIYMPGLDPEPAVVESCMYTVTPDHHFVLDRHPTHQNIIIGAGFSGHGFKFGPIVGKILCELSLGKVPTYDLSPFKIQRFQAHVKSAL